MDAVAATTSSPYRMRLRRADRRPSMMERRGMRTAAPWCGLSIRTLGATNRWFSIELKPIWDFFVRPRDDWVRFYGQRHAFEISLIPIELNKRSPGRLSFKVSVRVTATVHNLCRIDPMPSAGGPIYIYIYRYMYTFPILFLSFSILSLYMYI